MADSQTGDRLAEELNALPPLFLDCLRADAASSVNAQQQSEADRNRMGHFDECMERERALKQATKTLAMASDGVSRSEKQAEEWATCIVKFRDAIRDAGCAEFWAHIAEDAFWAPAVQLMRDFSPPQIVDLALRYHNAGERRGFEQSRFCRLIFKLWPAFESYVDQQNRERLFPDPDHAAKEDSLKEATTNAEGKAKRKIPAAEAESLVRKHLQAFGKENTLKLTCKSISSATGVSVGAVQKTRVWRAFEDRRKQQRPASKLRTVPLTKKMLAVLPGAGSADPCATELAEAIREQQEEMHADERPRKRPRS